MIRIYQVHDGQLWANVAKNTRLKDVQSEIEDYVKNLGQKSQPVNMKRVDLTKHEYEAYMTERHVHGHSYLHVVFVIDNGDDYIRPDGVYYDEVRKRNNISLINTDIDFYPTVRIKDDSETHYLVGMPTFALSTPTKSFHGGACPQRGGDYGHYPEGNGGSSWPTTYQEIVPICCGFATDVKFMTNLYAETWDNDGFGAGNAGSKTAELKFEVDPNIYGQFDDPYLKNKTNPYMMKFADKILEENKDVSKTNMFI